MQPATVSDQSYLRNIRVWAPSRPDRRAMVPESQAAIYGPELISRASIEAGILSQTVEIIAGSSTYSTEMPGLQSEPRIMSEASTCQHQSFAFVKRIHRWFPHASRSQIINAPNYLTSRSKNFFHVGWQLFSTPNLVYRVRHHFTELCVTN